MLFSLYLDDDFNKQDKQGIRGLGRGRRRGRGASLERGKDEAAPSRGRGKPPGKKIRYTSSVYSPNFFQTASIIYIFSIYTLSDLGNSSNLTG